MSLYLDIRYVGLVSSRLQKFTPKRDYLFTFRCPYCGDSKKSSTKTRGYFYRGIESGKQNSLFFKCQNCGKWLNLPDFLKEQAPELFREYLLEKFREERKDRKPDNEPAPVITNSPGKRPEFLDHAYRITELPDGHYAREYIRSRLIPETHWVRLFYTPDFGEIVKRALPDNQFNLKPNDERIVIPFYNKDKEVVAFQGRALGRSSLRYITIKLREDVQKIYGLERLNPEHHIFVVEGPIDSLFLPNCLALAGADFPDFSEYKSHMTIVYDNEPRNREILQRMEKAINLGYSVCIWPDTMLFKDINDMVMQGYSSEELVGIIRKNSHSGLKAKIKFSSWKKR